MNHKPLFILALLLVALSAALAPPPAQAATFTVTRTDDPPPDGCKPGDCSLREAVIAANISAGADTIIIPADTFTLSLQGGDPAADVDELDITHDVTIIGAGTEGANTTKIINDVEDVGFLIWPDAKVEMSNLVITGGDAGPGGVIVNSGNLTLMDVVISNNWGLSAGGIYNSGVLTLIRVAISENRGGEGSGGIFNSSTGSLIIVDSTFSKNRTSNDYGFGGAILSWGTISVTRTTFNMNEAAGGGAIYNFGSTAVATLTEITLTSNSASGLDSDNTRSHGGGAIVNDEGTLSLERSTVSGNNSGADGGGILNDTGVMTITTSSIYNNSAATAGGGIHNRNEEFAKGVVSLSHSTLSSNSAGQSGGGLFNDLFGATANLSQVTVANNTADSDNNGSGDGGGIFYVPVPPYVRSGIVRLAGTLLAGNVDRGGEAPDCGGGQLNSQGYNLVQHVTGCTLGGDASGNLTGVDPLLGPLADNGGLTLTHLPQAGSPAIDAGDPANCPVTDQRGFPRLVDGDGNGAAICDIGAVEFGATTEQFVYLPLVIR